MDQDCGGGKHWSLVDPALVQTLSTFTGCMDFNVTCLNVDFGIASSCRGSVSARRWHQVNL